MKVLAIDTSNQPLLVALADDHNIVGSFQTDKPKNHSVDLLPAVRHLLSEQGVFLSDIDQIAVAKGPGSFTGLRIGITVGKVLADTLKKPLYAISSLQALAKQVQLEKQEKAIVLAMFDARNDNVFAGAYLADKPVLEDGHYPIDEVLLLIAQMNEPVIVVGDGAHFEEKIEEELGRQPLTILSRDESLPTGVGLVNLVDDSTLVTDVANLTPAYLRKTQAELNWEQKQQGKPLDKPYVFEV
ncbi:tRNA (adenosine(37)-N6)-threonylcarbamoyltransferase complex dimerization subunit type 1 TsaB [Fructobacillus sp. M1-13]|uniref:tRNA (Adenosine(37)-N6)-threonylcarbamoyltransferase complex dimerization subunit type 1 TsaB n=1 Tax=Fructobacillus papyriferae TaxID=2713171 RepID=A0ABS5QS65_9LACO|nr:tRNA (adenosine(37)-N6)-threonylcarbamoyltransferase complex dimerization subunit type 1 TsaB [Fructobacillus papyriferae]MBS9335315.1 tRNA (adenosine(37)-N6)-threonylcarbamoyltransferase complex dimerization subunit type 1 TsaB [Fructobacillus papyriferae]MCD2159016.1 tRNA (adenosine(37)-N6)-threonylcarbamoyltransferase complex dimerization subunit type 1 TsaB [Fructobacillus papyriferae]